MSRYFSGESSAMGTVTALPHTTFAELCAGFLAKPVRLALTRAEFFALPKKDKTAARDQSRVKCVRYITPAQFKSSPSPRNYEHVLRCNLIALDIDDPTEAKRLLAQDWSAVLGDFGYIVWRTVSSTPDSPRLRVLVNAQGIPLSAYPQAVRTVAEMIGLASITSESRVAAQPMYLPTVFADDAADASPVVVSSPDGEAFTLADIIADDDSALVDGKPNVRDTGDVADLDYLRSPLEGVMVEDARDALQHLDPDCTMMQWIEIGAGLKHQFGDDGFELWNEWSAKGKKYDTEEETRYRWNSLKANTVDRAPVTIRSVFKHATARGWSNTPLAQRNYKSALDWLKSPARSTEELMDQGAKRIAKVGVVLGQLEKKSLMVALKDVMAARNMPLPLTDIKQTVRRLELDAMKQTGVPAWTKGLCYVTAGNFFYRYTTDRRFAPEVLDIMYGTLPTGDEKPMRPRDIATRIASVQQVENLRYDPAQGTKRFFSDGGVPYVNTYRQDYAGPTPETADQAGEVYWDHITKLIREPEYARVMTDFLAYMVQNPGRKIRWAPLIQSGEGAGKTTLHQIMGVVLGRRNVTKVNGNKVMESNWNDWAYGRQLITIEEVRIIGSNRHAVMDKLKPLITDDDIDLAKRFEDHRTVANVANYILFTNYQDALAVTESGRRYFVLISPLQQPEDIVRIGGKRHFDRLYAAVRDNPGGFRAWFEQWKISPDFDPEGRAPVTPYLHEFAENSASPLTSAVRAAIEDGSSALVTHDLLSLTCLRGCLATESDKYKDYSDQALGSVLRELGYTKHGRVMIEGGKHQLWYKHEFPDIRQTAENRLKGVTEASDLI